MLKEQGTSVEAMIQAVFVSTAVVHYPDPYCSCWQLV